MVSASTLEIMRNITILVLGNKGNLRQKNAFALLRKALRFYKIVRI
jgi:hypothetical protein